MFPLSTGAHLVAAQLERKAKGLLVLAFRRWCLFDYAARLDSLRRVREARESATAAMQRLVRGKIGRRAAQKMLRSRRVLRYTIARKMNETVYEVNIYQAPHATALMVDVNGGEVGVALHAVMRAPQIASLLSVTAGKVTLPAWSVDVPPTYNERVYQALAMALMVRPKNVEDPGSGVELVVGCTSKSDLISDERLEVDTLPLYLSFWNIDGVHLLAMVRCVLQGGRLHV